MRVRVEFAMSCLEGCLACGMEKCFRCGKLGVLVMCCCPACSIDSHGLPKCQPQRKLQAHQIQLVPYDHHLHLLYCHQLLSLCFRLGLMYLEGVKDPALCWRARCRLHYYSRCHLKAAMLRHYQRLAVREQQFYLRCCVCQEPHRIRGTDLTAPFQQVSIFVTARRMHTYSIRHGSGGSACCCRRHSDVIMDLGVYV